MRYEDCSDMYKSLHVRKNKVQTILKGTCNRKTGQLQYHDYVCVCVCVYIWNYTNITIMFLHDNYM